MAWQEEGAQDLREPEENILEAMASGVVLKEGQPTALPAARIVTLCFV